jgi:hypothetical protein
MSEGKHFNVDEVATVDLDRAKRCGFPEVVLGQGKQIDWLVGIIRKIATSSQDCLVTRVSDEQTAELAKQFPLAQIDRVGRTFWLPTDAQRLSAGRVAVLSAGTSDLPVAREALVTAEALGAETALIVDVGVAGLHRLLSRQDEFAVADAIVVVAGMDGALPSVVGGLVACPVIAVPTSVGYGTAFGGLAALLTMLNTCSANVVTVNIDAGFKAGYVAGLIARKAGLNNTKPGGSSPPGEP